jgi:MATE family multidrug resistance protein
MIFSNITVPLLGLVDTAVIGHLDSPVYLGGVAVGATATSFLFMLLLFLRMSTTGLTAQAFGAKDPLRLARALVQPLGLALGAGVLIVLFACRYRPGAAYCRRQRSGAGAGATLSRNPLAQRAGIAGKPGAARLAAGRAVRPGAGDFAGGRQLLNIVLDLWLVMGLHMNVQGAALATVTAEYVTLLLAC